MLLTPVEFDFFDSLWKEIYVKMIFSRVSCKCWYPWAPQLLRAVGVFSQLGSFTHWYWEYFLASLTPRHPKNVQNQWFSSSYHWNCIFHSSLGFIKSFLPWRSPKRNFLVSFHISHRLFFLTYVFFSLYWCLSRVPFCFQNLSLYVLLISRFIGSRLTRNKRFCLGSKIT